MIGDLAALLAAPFAATVAFLGIHTYLGLHVLRRRVVFADLALAQLSALGATLAVALGHAPGDPAATGYALLFALAGALALTLSRAASAAVGQEAFVGILYVAATAATVLAVERAPQGAEHVKRVLVGTLLGIGPAQLAEIVPLYLGIALLHWLARRPLLAASEGRLGGRAAILWDLVFYASFGAVVTSSVAVAGVLLVFSFLIMPAVTGMLFARGVGAALLIGWGVGLGACLGGFAASLALDLPTGACLVLALTAALGLTALARILLAGTEAARRRARTGRAAVAGALLLMLAGSLWSLAAPGADQPLLALLDRAGLPPELFMRAGEAATYAEARETEAQYRAELEALSDRERRARWQAPALSDDEVRDIASYQQTYAEMDRGERFVEDHLLASARARERWLVALPLALASAAALVALLARRRARPLRLAPGDPIC